MKGASDELLLTPAELGEILRLPEKKVMDLRRVHNWPHVRLGKRIRFTHDQAQQIIRAHAVVGTKPAAGLPGQTPQSARRSA